jgi:hypothetical protein
MAKHKWSSYTILHPDHAKELNARAGHLEFNEGKSKQEAEHIAHSEYAKKHHIDAAAFHLRGAQAAIASSDRDEAKKHGTMYNLHMKKAGLDPMAPAPKEITEHESNKNRHYKFKAHSNDALVLDDEDLK